MNWWTQSVTACCYELFCSIYSPLLIPRRQINTPQKRQLRTAESISSWRWVGSTFWKIKQRCVNKGHFKAPCSSVMLEIFLSSVPVVLLPSLHHLLLCRPAIFTQSLWLCCPPSCSRHVPLLSLPELQVCEYCALLLLMEWVTTDHTTMWLFLNTFSVSRAGLSNWGRLPSFKTRRNGQRRTRPDSGGPET